MANRSVNRSAISSRDKTFNRAAASSSASGSLSRDSTTSPISIRLPSLKVKCGFASCPLWANNCIASRVLRVDTGTTVSEAIFNRTRLVAMIRRLDEAAHQVFNTFAQGFDDLLYIIEDKDGIDI